MADHTLFVGLDVHKRTIAVATAPDTPGASCTYYGTITNTPDALRRLCKKLAAGGAELHLCYEAGPCGYVVQRRLSRLGHRCDVVAPTLIPRKAGDRVTNDRRDAMTLAQNLRAGHLIEVWVPDEAHEAMRDLVRMRALAKRDQRRARQQLQSFLLRHGRTYSGTSWSKAHRGWLADLRFAQPAQQLVLQEHVQRIERADELCERIHQAIVDLLPAWTLAPVVEAVQAVRGVAVVNAATLVAEIGCFGRFDHPRQLMAYLGLVPSEHSSGQTIRRGPITKSGNTLARTCPVEAAWTYRFPARVSRIIQGRSAHLPEPIRATAWKAQVRLTRRYRRLMAAGKVAPKVVTAIARELIGFIWASARMVEPRTA